MTYRAAYCYHFCSYHHDCLYSRLSLLQTGAAVMQPHQQPLFGYYNMAITVLHLTNKSSCCSHMEKGGRTQYTRKQARKAAEAMQR